MDYKKPTVTLGQGEVPTDPEELIPCVPGFAFALAYAAAVWDVAAAVNYFGVTNAVAFFAVSFVAVGTKCFGK